MDARTAAGTAGRAGPPAAGRGPEHGGDHQLRPAGPGAAAADAEELLDLLGPDGVRLPGARPQRARAGPRARPRRDVDRGLRAARPRSFAQANLGRLGRASRWQCSSPWCARARAGGSGSARTSPCASATPGRVTSRSARWSTSLGRLVDMGGAADQPGGHDRRRYGRAGRAPSWIALRPAGGRLRPAPCTSTTRTARRWPTRWPPCGRACARWTPRPAGSVAARSPERDGEPGDRGPGVGARRDGRADGGRPRGGHRDERLAGRAARPPRAPPGSSAPSPAASAHSRSRRRAPRGRRR